MGVPKFFRYISERYPCLSEMVKEYQLPEFDNLYLDMNGIIHTCSHPDDGDPHFRITEEKIIADIFHYIEVLFRMIKPQKLFFMAIDGVAPRAKMNQQRGRRFRTAREALELEEKALAKGEKLPSEARFDSNCITPGTEFMAKLQEQLKYFVVSKISTDPLWQKCKIILSGHETPGEGEHKIMDYIRYMRAQPNYDPNTRHCLYGLDADLVMLGLCTHEPHFSLLREEVKFGKKSTKRNCVPEQITFFLLHLSLMREYLELEFLSLKKDLPFTYDFEHIIDDWVLMGFLVGNDFIPHLPNMHINSGALPLLYKAYMSVLPQLGGYINESGILNLERFEKFMKKLAEIDLEHFSDTYVDLKWFESKTGRQFSDKKHPLAPYDFEEEDEENGVNKKDVPENWEDNSESETSDSDDDLFLAEFKQHKTDYYMNKLEYEDVTPEVLKSQAEGYVRAIQWNLHYYYNGVCSWSWYYPHHYAPYVSDIQGFKDLKLEFELGKPFRPFEQLLAVLPSASRNLLPTAYQSLMTAEDSPIKNYYPEQFETDLNGKKQEWEAVVLIPFIDEERLLKAMKSCNEQLTPEEKRRNTPGPMLIYEHDIEGMGRYEAPAYFPPVQKAYFKCTTVSIDEIRIPTEKLIKGAYPGLKMDVYYPGFPTLKHLKYTASIKKAKVKVFEQPSRGENMIVNIVQEEEGPSLDVLAKEMLGNVVYIAWPHLVEATVVSISNEQYRYVATQAKGQYNVEENKGSTNFWKLQVNGITQYYANRLGINVGETKVLVHVKVMAGRKYVFTPQGRVNLEKQWADVESVYPLQTVVKNISVHEKKYAMYKSLGSVFPVGSKCFMLGQPYYGACGNVVESKDSLKNGRIQIVMIKIEEPDFTEAKRIAEEVATRYMSLHVAAVKLSISKSLFSRITGCILIIPAGYRDVGTEYSEMPKVNVGLNLKFNKKNEEIPGYTRKDVNSWVYSEKAVALVESYLQQFPILVEYLNKNGGNDVYFEEDIFPFGDGKEELKEITTWIKKQPYYTIERQVCGSLTVDPDAVKKIEETVGNFKKTAKAKKITMQVKPHLLYVVGLQIGNIMPDPTTTFYLYDRVVNVRGSYTVPVGLKGTVVAIHKPPDAKDEDTMYDVLFDETFTGGLQLNCSSPRAYRLPRSAMINITHGLRVLNKKTGFPGQLLQNLSLDSSKITSNPRPNPSPNVPNNYYPPPAVNTGPYPNWGFPYSPVSNYGNFRPLQVYNNSNNSNVPFRNNVPYHPRPYGPPPVQGGPERYPIAPAPYPPSSRNNFMPMFGEKQQMKHNYYEQQWQSSYQPTPTSNKVKSSTTVTKESEQMPNTDQPKIPVPKVDTELLKKMLRINEVSNKQKQAPTVANKPEVVAAKIKDSTPLNLQDIFEHAKKRSQIVQDDDTFSFFTAKLLNYFKFRNLGCPRYQFFELSDDRFQAQIALPDGSVATGTIMDTKENAYESAAGEALKRLGVGAPQSTSSAPLREQNEITCPLEMNKNRYERETKIDKEKNFVKIKPDPVEKKTKQQGNNQKVENDKGVANKFVPLQAIRNRTKSTSKTNVDNNVAPSVSGATTTNEKECEKNRNEAEKNTTNQVSKNASSRRKRERKMRIAANFQAATYGK